ncbi:MAG: alpha/beta hydrolase [Anaerolineae bacterium]|nr:alpha/beta hydrolase [Anaerolineae bacterium]
MPTITLNHQPFFYALHRSPQADFTIILIHGAGGSHLVWPLALRRLPNATVYALDLSGHGRSAGEGHAHIEGYAAEVMQFIEMLALTNVVLVGHSMGGAIAQTIALRHLPELAALVLIGTAASLRVSPAILDQILPDFEQAVATINHFSWSPSAPPQLVKRGEEMLAQTAVSVLYNDFNACNEFDIRNQIAHITLPTLVVAAAEDKLTPPKNGRFLADTIPQAQFTLLDGAGHMMMVEKPGETAEAVKQFLIDD